MKPPEIIRLNPQFYLFNASEVLNHGLIDPFLFSKIIASVMRDSKIKPLGFPTVVENPDDEIYGYYRRTSRGGFISAEIMPYHLMVAIQVFSATPFKPDRFRQNIIQHLKTESVTVSRIKPPAVSKLQSEPIILNFPGQTIHVD